MPPDRSCHDLVVPGGGFLAFADPPMQRAAGIGDDAALLLEDLRAVGDGHADAARRGAGTLPGHDPGSGSDR